MTRLAACAALAVVLLAPVHARGETRRLAVVVGSNAGAGDRPPLRFAETDAGKFARVLTELGGHAAEDVLLVQGRRLPELEEALTQASRRVAGWHRSPETRVVLLFYFSGHSDGSALELGRDRLTFVRLRQWLDETGADVRIGIVDACRSGSLLAAKGGRPGVGFDVRLVDDLATSGSVFLSSSAADEVALESSEIGGSFFTHHFVSGLRGAADASGDGQVTLNEAYRHAFERTVSETSAFVSGAQHPHFDVRLSGRGELILTELARPGATLVLPSGFERAFVVNVTRDLVVAELRAGDPTKVAVEPGSWAVRAWRGGEVFGGRWALAAGETRDVAWKELTRMDPPGRLARKGDDERAPGSFRIGLLGGVGAGIAENAGVRAHGMVAWRHDGGLRLGLGGFIGRGPDFWEPGAYASVGWDVEVAVAALQLGGGVDLFGGVVQQRLDDGVASTGGMGGAGLRLGAALRLGVWELGLESRLALAILRRDGAVQAVPLPMIGLAVAVRP